MARPEKFQVAAEKSTNRAENRYVSSTRPGHEYPKISAQELLIQLRTDRIKLHIVFLHKKSVLQEGNALFKEGKCT